MRLILYSDRALYPMHWYAFETICRETSVQGFAFARPDAAMADVHRSIGWARPDPWSSPPIRMIPVGTSAARVRWLRSQLREIRPDAIWLQQEPTDLLALELLLALRLDRQTRIVCAVCENIFDGISRRQRLAGRALWPRIDALAATATPSIEAIRAVGFPRHVPTATLLAGALPPPAEIPPMSLPFAESFTVGFAGRLVAEKGWRIVLEALEALPTHFVGAFAGSADEEEAFHQAVSVHGLDDRVVHVGLLDRAALWRFYAALDVLVVPSLTTPTWKEQFGGVIADGLAAGVPVVGSSSGSIPEVVGQAGIVVPEGDAEALAGALADLEADAELRARLSATGRERYEREFSIPAYAAKLADLLGLEMSPQE